MPKVSTEKLQELLISAEEALSRVNIERETYAKLIAELMKKQNQHLNDISLLRERVDVLEKVVHRSDEQMSEASILISALIEGIDKLQVEAKLALEVAEQGVENVELQKKIRKISEAAVLSDEKEMIDEYNEQIAALRAKVTKTPN